MMSRELALCTLCVIVSSLIVIFSSDTNEGTDKVAVCGKPRTLCKLNIDL